MHVPSTPRGFFGVALNNPKTSINVGAALRAAACFGANFILASGNRAAIRPSATDTFKSIRHIPVTHTADIIESLPYDCVPVAVDILPGAINLPEYSHPERACYIFGPEDGTLGTSITSRCRDIVAIPSHGCLNLAAAVNVILYDRIAKGGQAKVEAAGSIVQDAPSLEHFGCGSCKYQQHHATVYPCSECGNNLTSLTTKLQWEPKEKTK